MRRLTHSELDEHRPRRTRSGARELLEEFLQTRSYLPAGARAMKDAEALPVTFRHHAEAAEQTGALWGAWTEQERLTRFVTATPRSAVVGGRRGWVLDVRFYDCEARCVSAGIWLRQAPSVWALVLV